MKVSDRDLIIAHLIIAHYHINKFSELWDESMRTVGNSQNDDGPFANISNDQMWDLYEE